MFLIRVLFQDLTIAIYRIAPCQLGDFDTFRFVLLLAMKTPVSLLTGESVFLASHSPPPAPSAAFGGAEMLAKKTDSPTAQGRGGLSQRKWLAAKVSKPPRPAGAKVF